MSTPPGFDGTCRLMQALAAIAMIVVALEWQAMQAADVVRDAWPARVLRGWWGWRRALMANGVVRSVPLVQVTLASALLLAALLDDRQDPLAYVGAGGLALSIWHTAVRVRGTMNGGSDGMLFTVLVALTVATLPLSESIRNGALLYTAAQVLLSYLRAGVVKARERAWWTGEALAAFLAVPAYGVPAWVPRHGALLRTASVAIMLFELAAPLALVSLPAAVTYTAVAWCFHLATAAVFGLNRFVLAWSAALPAVWFAAGMLHPAW